MGARDLGQRVRVADVDAQFEQCGAQIGTDGEARVDVDRVGRRCEAESGDRRTRPAVRLEPVEDVDAEFAFVFGSLFRKRCKQR